MYAVRRARAAIEAGMKVVGCDGRRIGTVARIFRPAPPLGDEERPTPEACSTCDAYLMVARLPVFDPLYIPVGQVRHVRQGQVVLPVPADAIERQGWVGRRASLPSGWHGA